MLYLLFELGADRYALDARAVAEVLPLVTIKHIPQAPPAVAGIFNYRGAPVPVVDVSQLALGRPAERRLSTRILLVNHEDDDGQPRLLGLIVERVTQTVRRDESDFVPAGVSSAAAPYLGPVATDPRGLVQRVNAAALLPQEVRAVLFKAPRADG